MAKSPTPKESAVVPLQPNARTGGAAKPATSVGPAQPAAEPTPAEKSAPKKRKWLKWVLAAMVPLIAIAGGATWYLTGDEAPPSNSAPPPAPEKPAVFVPIDQFTVNLVPETGDQYLQTALVAKVGSSTTMEAIKQQMPEVRYRLILTLSNKRPSEIATVAGKQALAAEVAAQIKQTLPAAMRDDVIAVFFTSFVVQ